MQKMHCMLLIVSGIMEVIWKLNLLKATEKHHVKCDRNMQAQPELITTGVDPFRRTGAVENAVIVLEVVLVEIEGVIIGGVLDHRGKDPEDIVVIRLDQINALCRNQVAHGLALVPVREVLLCVQRTAGKKIF
ncbi:hypothetical protein D917_00003 [Trichinella nativa]|uniref:Secreted protein n=1 Tax=Trichinella nativa TaxID=6335 RepID=A0A1Y3E862_9BILA|nr:hypothetical protein D917_00003 [Trichinella nativa]